MYWIDRSLIYDLRNLDNVFRLGSVRSTTVHSVSTVDLTQIKACRYVCLGGICMIQILRAYMFALVGSV